MNPTEDKYSKLVDFTAINGYYTIPILGIYNQVKKLYLILLIKIILFRFDWVLYQFDMSIGHI